MQRGLVSISSLLRRSSSHSASWLEPQAAMACCGFEASATSSSSISQPSSHRHRAGPCGEQSVSLVQSPELCSTSTSQGIIDGLSHSGWSTSGSSTSSRGHSSWLGASSQHGQQLRGFAASASAQQAAAAAPKAAASGKQAGGGSSKEKGLAWLPSLPNPAKHVAKPEDAVGAHSPLLKSYRKHITPRQLVFRINKRPGIKMLPDLLKLYQTKIDFLVVAAALSKIHTTQKQAALCASLQAEGRAVHKPVSYDEQAAAATVAWLRPFLEFQLRYAVRPTIAAALWAWAGLQGAPKQALPAELAAAMLARATAAKEGRQEHPLQLMTPKTLALLAWSASRILPANAAASDPRVGPAVEALVRFAGGKLQQFSPQGLSMLALGCARLAPKASQGLVQSCADQAVARYSDPMARRLRPRELVRVVQACAASDTRPRLFLEKVVGVAYGQRERWEPELLVSLVESLKAVGVQHDGLFKAAAELAPAGTGAGKQ